MSKEKANAEEFQTFERCPHDRENPYSMTSNSLIRDEKMSPNCRWMLIYMLSNKEGWVIKVSQVISHVKGFIGRDKIYKLIDEAEDAGYLKKEVVYRKNPRGGTLKGFKYIVSEFPKFKKCFRYPDVQDAGDQYAGHKDGKEAPRKEKPSKEIIYTKEAIASEEKESLAPLLSETDQKRKESCEALLAYCATYGLVISQDTILRWLLKWNEERLLRNLSLLGDRIKTQVIKHHEKWMETALKNDFGLDKENEDFNREAFMKLYYQHPLPEIKVTKKYITHKVWGKEIYFKLDRKTFSEQVRNLVTK